MIRRRGVLLLLTVVACLAAVPTASAMPGQASTSIVKGSVAPIESLPWLAAIGHRDLLGDLGQCTGTVVAPRVVLTAGHCVLSSHGDLRAASGYSVLTGIADVRKATRANVSKVSRVLMFPDYDPEDLRADAGLLILSAPVSAPALPLAGPADAALLTPGTPLTVAGWGTTEAGGPASPLLRSGAVAVQGTPTCRKGAKPSELEFFAASEFCTKAPPRFEVITCHGDSGGPAIARRADGSLVQVGITSKGHFFCDPELPDYLTRVDTVSAWVGEWIAAIEAGAPEPKVKAPKIVLPSLPVSALKSAMPSILESEFDDRFRGATKVRISCRQVKKSRASCTVGWRKGDNKYSGAVTVAFLLRSEGVFETSRYKISWVSDRCLRSSSRAACLKTKTHEELG